MPSIEKMMEMLATLVVFGLLALVFFSIFGSFESEIQFAHAYPVTQRLTCIINMLSAGPENESAILEISPGKYTITFMGNYIESSVDFIGKSKYGLFVFPDIILVPPDPPVIESDGGPKTIYIAKVGNSIFVDDEPIVNPIPCSPDCYCIGMGPCMVYCNSACCPDCSGWCCE